jgi:cytoskeletal protein CcmA (bactofilin family)
MLNKGSIFSGNRESSASTSGAGKVITSNVPSATSSSAVVPAAARTPEPQGTPSEPQGAKLVVGPGVKLKGAEIQDCDMLLVEGRVEATMDSRLIQIADQGSFDGKVTIDFAEIRGRFSGELTAREQLVIHSTGRVNGKIRYGKIIVHEGGELSGDIRSLNATEPANVAIPTKTVEPTVAANAEDHSVAAMGRLLAAKTA